jgi:hypothetical protein
MRASSGKSRWSHCVLAVALAVGSSSVIGSAIPDNASRTPSASDAELRPNPEQARAFLTEWLRAQGYPSPRFEVADIGIPKGADAATFCKARDCVIRIRPESLTASIGNKRREGSPWRQWQNLMLHEALHFIDVQRRGSSDHGNAFKALVREFDIAHLRH